MLTTKETED